MVRLTLRSSPFSVIWFPITRTGICYDFLGLEWTCEPSSESIWPPIASSYTSSGFANLRWLAWVALWWPKNVIFQLTPSIGWPGTRPSRLARFSKWRSSLKVWACIFSLALDYNCSSYPLTKCLSDVPNVCEDRSECLSCLAFLTEPFVRCCECKPRTQICLQVRYTWFD